MNLTIHDESGRSILLHNKDLLVAVDETGQENFSDKNFPLFGLSACIFLCNEYQEGILKPWNKIKESAGLKEKDALHASEVDVKNIELINRLKKFFKNSAFSRIAVGCSKNTIFKRKIKPVDLCVNVLFDNIRKAFSIYKPNNIVILIESSSRLNNKYKNTFMNNKLFVDKKGVMTIIGLVEKKHAFPPIEIADFIAQAHGNHILRELNSIGELRKDMASVFVKNNALYSYNKHITEVA